MSKNTTFSNKAVNEHTRLLALAALFEVDFSVDWLQELSGMKASQILSTLNGEISQGCVRQKEPGVFCFRDIKDRQRWQALLPSEEKELMHRRIAEFLLLELPDGDTKALAVAPHLVNISNDAQKCRWLIRAGDIHLRAFRIERAFQCYTSVIDSLAGLQGEEIDSLFIEGALAYSKIATGKHRTQKVKSILREGLNRAIKWDKKNYEALLKMHLAKNEWLCSRYQSALRYFEQGWSMAKKMADPKLLRLSITFSTFFLFWQGRFKEAVIFYEKSVDEVDKYPQGKFPILAAIIMGRAYAHTGQITQALGMLDGICAHCRSRRDLHLAAHAGGALGATLLEIGHIDDAIQALQTAMEEASQGPNEWVKVWVTYLLAFAYYLKNDNKQAVALLRKYIQRSKSIQVSVHLFPYLLEFLWGMEQGEFPCLPGLSLSKEIRRIMRSENVFLKGVAFRFQALLHRKRGLKNDEIMKSINISLELLAESGDQVELSKSYLELAREYLLSGNKERAKEATLKACKILPSLSKFTVPDDLCFLIKESSGDRDKTFLNEILRLSHEVATIRDNKELVQQIISAVNQITGAERGAIFLLENDSHSPMFQLRASKNLTADQISHVNFSSSMKMIEETALTGKGQIQTMRSSDGVGSLGEIIRSRICVPMILKGKVIGVLYHDNRLFSSTFKESDMELLAYFSAQAAITIDNARAYEEINHLNQKFKEEKFYYEEQHLQNLHFQEIVGESQPTMKMLAQMDQVAKTDSTVLILGETGVGKELVARAIHRRSHRYDQPFVWMFCSAIPDSLIPSELFGHEKGAFTGATHRRIGRFELADGGTIFLDEIGDLPLEVQVRLLRVLQSMEFERVGGNTTIHSDFRLVAATNRNLEQAVKAGSFRSDLYYRLNVFPIYVPPLREREKDIPLLAHYFLKIYATKMGKTFEVISKSDMDKLIQYDWPGNVRELENIIERGAILSHSSVFRVPELGVSHPEVVHPEEDTTLSGNERRHILWALQKTGWKVRGLGGAAELLKIHPSTLAFRMKKLGIQRPPRFPPPGKEVQQVDLLR